jgi:hypothetical protein
VVFKKIGKNMAYTVDLYFAPTEASLERPFGNVEDARRKAVDLSSSKRNEVYAVWNVHCEVEFIAIDGKVYKAE